MRITLLLLALLAGCAQPVSPPPDASHAPAESAAPLPEFLVAARAVVPAPFDGPVLEVLPAGGYTYLRVGSASEGARWVVVIAQDAAVGDDVAVRPYGQLSHFDSRRTGRTFDRLLFATLDNRSI
ncbi:MAG: hypothetical protein KDA24_18705 [Deltaproteobacteria bacterium]|nr:hypothetical protein [Deltaproteobacteria bacterium]